MTILNIEDSIVLIIDVQEKLLNAAFSKDSIEKKSAVVSKAANILGIPLIITEQYPKGLGETIPAIEGGKRFEKITFSALENSEVLEALKSSCKKQVVIFGIETHICVSQTVTALRGLGNEVHVVKDACGSRAEAEHHAGLERMKDNGAHFITAEIAIFEWLKSAKHPNFKEVQSLIK